jgi:glutathione S-transferase
MESRLVEHTYLVGDTLTMADISWFTRVDTFGALRMTLAPERYPNILRWYERVGQRPAVAASSGGL